MASQPTNLIINYLPQNMDETGLGAIFSKIGPIDSIKIIRDARTGYSYGFGFVKYSQPESAEKAVETLNGLRIQNKSIKVSFSRPPGEDIKNTNLYITGVPSHFTESDMECLFSKFGEIVTVKVLKDKLTGMPRGVAFVRFGKHCEAVLALEQMNGMVPEGGTEPLIIKLAEDHGKQKAAFFAGLNAGFGN